MIFEAELTENVLYIRLHPESIIGPTMVGPGEKCSKMFKIEVFSRLESAILILVFANTVTTSFINFFRNYVVFDNEVTQFYLNFLKFQKLEV